MITLRVGCWWDALLGQPLCSSKGAPAPCWALPIPQSIPRTTTSKVPSALEGAGAAGGLGWVAARAAAAPHSAAVPAGASGEEWGTCTPRGSRLPGCCFIAFRRGCGWEQGGTDVVGLGVTGSARQGQRRGGYRGGTACIEPPPNIASPQIRSHLRSPLQKESALTPPPFFFF